MSIDHTSEWGDQLRVACQVLSRAASTPAMAIRLTGRLEGPTGQAVPVLMLTRQLAVEHGLEHQASLEGRVLSIRLMHSAPMYGAGEQGRS